MEAPRVPCPAQNKQKAISPFLRLCHIITSCHDCKWEKKTMSFLPCSFLFGDTSAKDGIPSWCRLWFFFCGRSKSSTKTKTIFLFCHLKRTCLILVTLTALTGDILKMSLEGPLSSITIGFNHRYQLGLFYPQVRETQPLPRFRHVSFPPDIFATLAYKTILQLNHRKKQKNWLTKI